MALILPKKKKKQKKERKREAAFRGGDGGFFGGADRRIQKTTCPFLAMIIAAIKPLPFANNPKIKKELRFSKLFDSFYISSFTAVQSSRA